jgi:hypothetical protein
MPEITQADAERWRKALEDIIESGAEAYLIRGIAKQALHPPTPELSEAEQCWQAFTFETNNGDMLPSLQSAIKYGLNWAKKKS